MRIRPTVVKLSLALLLFVLAFRHKISKYCNNNNSYYDDTSKQPKHSQMNLLKSATTTIIINRKIEPPWHSIDVNILNNNNTFTPAPRLAIIVPYRDRKPHLGKFAYDKFNANSKERLCL